jgi:Zn-dependent peptidase ImmA (M78 family)
MNGEKYQMLALARESRGLTQSQLVEKVPNLNQGNYSKMEKGFLNIPQETLYNIASILDYPISFFYKNPVNTPISSFYYRKRVTMAKKDLSILEAKLDIIRMMIDELLNSVDLPEFNLPTYKISNNFSASNAAIKIRDFFRLPRGPIINLIQTIESAGIIIYMIKTETQKFDGITLITDKGQPIIFVNANLSNDRKQMTLAHELGHLVMHIPNSPLPKTVDEEAEAYEFAGELLMPYLDCRNDIMNLKYSQLGILKTYWKVSKAALVYRAKETLSISHARYINLNIELSKNGEKKKETGFIDIIPPTLIPQIISAYENDLNYSLNEILNLLCLNKTDYFEYFNQSKHDTIVITKKIIDMDSYMRRQN